MKTLNKVLGVIGLSVAAAPVMAAPVDYTSLTTAVDFSTTTAAILSILAAVVVVYIAWKGGKMIVSALRGA